MKANERYSTPAAFRRALSNNIKKEAENSNWTVQQLQRQVAYDRLLERLYFIDDGWIVKGATALLARDLGVRGSLDVDIYRAVASKIGEADLRRAVGLDLSDWFQFVLGTSSAIGSDSVRLPIAAVIGTTVWVEFHVDLSGTDLRMTGQPDQVPPIARGVIPNVNQTGYLAYPLSDHVADKVAATYERYGKSAVPSTRYRDLVDLVAIARGASITAGALRTAIRSEFQRRGLVIPKSFDVPDPLLWERGYSAEVKRSILAIEQTLDEAVDTVRAFLDPVLEGLAKGEWNPSELRWRE